MLMQLKRVIILLWSIHLHNITKLDALRQQITAWKSEQKTIAFVPTMGNLHEGHLALIKAAKNQADKVCCSIFVNPMQFGVGEDLEDYPRTLIQDTEKLTDIGCDLLFQPQVDLIYPRPLNESTKIEVPILSDILCGKSRAGHFVGVATIVCKLFNMVIPDVALFGKKDYQQLMVIRQMVEDLNIPIKIMGLETVREVDGLAMSSRNQYLTPTERQVAPLLYQILTKIGQQLDYSSKSDLIDEAIRQLNQNGFKVDYLEIQDAINLSPIDEQTNQAVILVAAYLGKTRLIDNLEVTL